MFFEDRDGDTYIKTEPMTSDPDSLEVLQRNYYYPFGMEMEGPWQAATAPRADYLYNGKELEEDLGLDWYAYGFRYYDATIGRFTGVDPIAPQYAAWSPYGYALDNPVKFIDWMGLGPTGDYYDQQGNYLGNDGIDDNRIYLVNDGVTADELGLNTDQFTGMLYSDVRAENTTEVGGLMILNRTAEGTDYTSGELTLIGRNGTDNTFTLEPGGPETTTPNQDRRIPDGVYNVDPYSSARYPDNYILSNEDVSQNRLILIHAGNYPSNTTGCILPGCTSGNGTVGQSADAVNSIRTFYRENNTSIIDTHDDIIMIINTQISN